MFDSAFDFHFAHWLHKEKISKRSITRLLNSPHMTPLTKHLSWLSSDELASKMRKMGTNESMDLGEWQSDEFEISAPHLPTRKAHYTLRHRSVEDAVRFFLGHKGFKDSLTY